MTYIPGYTSIVDLETISTRELIEILLQARGDQRCAHLRTKLNQRLERRSGRRGLGGARDKVLTNGRAKAALALNV
jgi:hypothetical protein